MSPFPITVAPKNVQNGTSPNPQANPARSNKGLGIDANRRMPRKPNRSMFSTNHFLALSTDDSLWLPNKSFNSSNDSPANLADHVPKTYPSISLSLPLLSPSPSFDPIHLRAKK
eukprot:TRINITY_DN5251_c3_g1_i1.p1 TRINITY_DN5251_c3_g1~~TRINITY_DN5251_c3_g1_i1.p1  ORF type:complete len:114 (-),score=18.63 TRINITY_DN5251_c3_g1_i1:23-364(-)